MHFSQGMGSNPETSYVSTGFKQTQRTGFPTVGEKVTNKRREQAKGKSCVLESKVSVQRHWFTGICMHACMHACTWTVYTCICTVLHMYHLALTSKGA